MTRDVDDIHSFDTGYIKAFASIAELDTSQANKKLITDFANACRHDRLAKSTITGYIQYTKRLLERLAEIGWEGDLDKIEYEDFSRLLLHLEDVHGLAQSSIRNYKKLVKKFYGWRYDGEPPRWVQRLKLENIETPVQPSDLITAVELEKLLAACSHPRDKAIIAVLADSGLRVGALGSCRIKNVVFNQYGGIIYVSATSRSKKAMDARGIPITWSTGYLNAWLSVHPLRDDPEAPLWVTLDKNREPMSYKTIRATLARVGTLSGIKKRVNPHMFRHTAITSWIMDGFNEQKIKHRAGWSKGSTRLFQVYANFTDKEMNDSIYEAYGLKTDDKKTVMLTKCPRCSNILKSGDRFCSQCSLVLDQKTAEEIKQYEDIMPALLSMIEQNSEAAQALKTYPEKK